MKENVATLRERIKEIHAINDDALFDPKKVVKMRVVVNTQMKASVFTLYRLIKSGKLKSTNIGTGAKPRYFIKGKDLKAFLIDRYQLQEIN